MSDLEQIRLAALAARDRWLADPSPETQAVLIKAANAWNNHPSFSTPGLAAAQPIYQLRSPRWMGQPRTVIPASANGDDLADREREDRHYGDCAPSHDRRNQLYSTDAFGGSI